MVAVVAALVLTAACGGSDSGASGGSDGGGDSSALLETAAKNVTSFEKGGEFPALPAPYDPGTGKVAIIACGLAGPDCKKGAEAAKEAAEQMGWTGTIFDAQFSPQKGSAFIDQAVQQGYDGVISITLPIETMKASADSAIAAGLTVSCVACFVAPGFDKVKFVSVDWADQGRQLAWYVIKRSKGKAKVLVYDAPNQAVNLRVKNFTETLTKECSTCEIADTSIIDQSEIGKPGPPTFAADLAKFPPGTITDITDPFDAIGVPMMKTLKQNGRTDVTVSGYDSTQEGIQGILDKSLPVGATVGLPYSYSAYVGVDAVARAKAGAPEYDGTKMPTILIDETNAEKYKDGYYTSPDFPQDFLTSWGK